MRSTDPMLDYCDTHPNTGDELQEWYREAYRFIAVEDDSKLSDDEIHMRYLLSQAIELLLKYSGRDFRTEFWKNLSWETVTNWAENATKLQQMEGKAAD